MKKDRVAYSMSSLLLISLVAMALLGPQLLFRVQDAYRMGNIWVEPLEEMDTARLSVSYQKSLYQRLSSFADGTAKGKNYFVAETDYNKMPVAEQDTDVYSILMEINNTANMYIWMDSLYATGNYFFLEGRIMDIKSINEWKRFVIYEEDFDNGVTLMMWYLDLELADGSRIRLLTDTEDYTLYAVYGTGLENSGMVMPMTGKRASDLEYVIREQKYIAGVMYDMYSSPVFINHYDGYDIDGENAEAMSGTHGIAQYDWVYYLELDQALIKDSLAAVENPTLDDLITLERIARDHSWQFRFNMDYENPLQLDYIISNEEADGIFFFWGFEEICNLITQMQEIPY